MNDVTQILSQIESGDPSAAEQQRGEPITRVSGGRIDIGAFEAQPIPPPIFGNYNQNGVVDAADSIVWRKVLGSSVAP